MDQFKAAQAVIDEMFEDKTKETESAAYRILAYAKRGVDSPTSLSHKEVQQVCYALVVHYAQMGIN